MEGFDFSKFCTKETVRYFENTRNINFRGKKYMINLVAYDKRKVDMWMNHPGDKLCNIVFLGLHLQRLLVRKIKLIHFFSS